MLKKPETSTSELLRFAESSPTATSLPIGGFGFEKPNEGNSNDWLTPSALLERLGKTKGRILSKAVRTDCVDGLNSLAEKSVACVVTSPPYNIGIKYATHEDNRSDYLEWMKSVFLAIKRVLADDGHFFLQVGGIPTEPLKPWLLLDKALEAGFRAQNVIVWVKNIAIEDVSYGHFKPVNSKRFENHTHEFIFHLTKTGSVPVMVSPNGTAWFIPYETANKVKDRPKHPAMFPIALPEKCITFSGVPMGSLVVDPFVGSGNTLIACDRLGMNGLGFDIDESYVQCANRRLERHSLATRHEDSSAVEDEVALTPQAATA